MVDFERAAKSAMEKKGFFLYSSTCDHFVTDSDRYWFVQNEACVEVLGWLSLQLFHILRKVLTRYCIECLCNSTAESKSLLSFKLEV